MACFSPKTAFVGKALSRDGFPVPVFKMDEAKYVPRTVGGEGYSLMTVPCGTCLACKAARASSWTVRNYCEGKMSLHSSFVTLTYANRYLPIGARNPTLVKSDAEASLHRLRDFVRRRARGDVRFFLAGEYGSRRYRPHYHALLFSDVDLWSLLGDMRPFGRSGALPIWRSSYFEHHIWKGGAAVFGTATASSAAYTARYVMKSDWDGGEEPVFLKMSRRPGLGTEFFNRYWRGMYPDGKVAVGEPGNIRFFNTPRFFDLKYREVDLPGYRALKLRRVEHAVSVPDEDRRRRLAAREFNMRRAMAEKERDVSVVSDEAFELLPAALVDGERPSDGGSIWMPTLEDLAWAREGAREDARMRDEFHGLVAR